MATQLEQFCDLRQNPFSAFVLGSVLVFFVLACLYESWSLPLAVFLVVSMCVLCASSRAHSPGLSCRPSNQDRRHLALAKSCTAWNRSGPVHRLLHRRYK
jgi:hypothetical protein